MLSWLLVFIGGGIGSVSRYAVSSFAVKHIGTSFPYGTLFVNIAGSLFLGFIVAYLLNRVNFFEPNLRLFLTVGFAGGFTTFSTFSLETLALIKEGQIAPALVYVAASVIIGLLAVYCGTVIGRNI